VPPSLIALHGFTMNAAGLKHMMADLEPRLEGVVGFVYPDAPHTAPESSVAAIAQLMGGFRPKPPNLQWWSASDDGSAYAGWEATRTRLASELAAHPEAGLLGFSQGGAVAAAIAAASSRGLLPPVRFVIAIAGFTPRAQDIAPLFAAPVRVPSLHVWGLADGMAKHSPRLAERFDPEQREIVTWPGRHTVPTSGNAADAIVSFVQRHAG
jgi:pimeloyl-ACP methyl ester carboxylesterase